jgi:hypothetical protein
MSHRSILPACMLVLSAAAASADDTKVIAFENDAGIVVAMEGAGAPGADPARRLVDMVARMESKLGPATPDDAPQMETVDGHSLAAVFRRFGQEPDMIHVLVTTDADSAICHIAGAMTDRMQAALPGAIQTCGSELMRVAATASAPAPAAKQAAAAPAPNAAFAGNWSNVAEVLFRSVAGIGVGGMVVMEFEPVVLLKDGSYYEVSDAALEDVDLAAERSARPNRFGRWSQSGDSYVLTNADGAAKSYALQDGALFKAYPAEQPTMLSTRYERISGGGNTALGGEVMVARSNVYIFLPDGRFQLEGSVGASSSGEQSGVSTTLQSDSAAAGRYTLDHHTLVLTFGDGRQERHFFAYASKGTPAQRDPGMIFIDDNTFTSDD